MRYTEEMQELKRYETRRGTGEYRRRGGLDATICFMYSAAYGVVVRGRCGMRDEL